MIQIHLLDGFLIDSSVDCTVAGLTIDRTDTLKKTMDDKIRVARSALSLAKRLA